MAARRSRTKAATLTARQVVDATSAVREGTVLRWSAGKPVRVQLDLRVPGATWEERHAYGRSLRTQTPREAHSGWKAPQDRPDPVAVIERTNAGRLAHLVPMRIGRMAASPLGFLRGADAVMAWDLAHTPVSGINVVIDGDAHLGNFGLYGTPQRDIVFDLNDFDEVAVGPWEWDLKRLVASINVAGRENGLTRPERAQAVVQCVEGYRTNARRLERMGFLDVWYVHAYPGRQGTRYEMSGKTLAIFEKAKSKAAQTTNASLLQKVASRSAGGAWRFREDPPILTRVDPATREKVIDGINEYADTLGRDWRYLVSRYHVVDVVLRVVGVGSVGTRAYLALLFGNDDNDPLFLQVKEATEPVHAPYLPPLPAEFRHNGWRVVGGQGVLQATSDVLLGYTTIDGRPFYVRQMKNMKASVPYEWLSGEPFEYYAWMCGSLLARGHGRTGAGAEIAGYCGTSDVLDRALARWAESYGDQNQMDYEALLREIKSGRVEALLGV